jgi:hypothetical protein
LVINDSDKWAVQLTTARLGACSAREVVACCSLPRETVEACLYTLAAEGKVKAKSQYIRRGKKGFSFVYWQSILQEGSYYSIREKMKERNPEIFARATRSKRSPRILIVDKVRRVMESYPGSYSTEQMCEETGATYNMVRKAFKELEREGVVTVTKQIYGRGRPRLFYSAVNGKEPEPEKKVWSFDDDEEAVDLE